MTYRNTRIGMTGSDDWDHGCLDWKFATSGLSSGFLRTLNPEESCNAWLWRWCFDDLIFNFAMRWHMFKNERFRAWPGCPWLMKGIKGLAMLEAMGSGGVPDQAAMPPKSIPFVEGPSDEGEGNRSATHKVDHCHTGVLNQNTVALDCLATTLFPNDPPPLAKELKWIIFDLELQVSCGVA